MKKVVFFITGLNSGGIENYLLRFLKFKASSFSEVVVYCKGGKGGHLENEYLEIPNVQIIKNNIGYFNILNYLNLLYFFKRGNYDVVCDFTGNFSGLILYCAKLSKIDKRIVFYRGSSNRFKETALRLFYNRIVRKLAYKYATSILSNSQSAFDFFYKKKMQDSRFQVIYNGVNPSLIIHINKNLRKEFAIPDNSFVVGHTGRFNNAKNHSIIIQVAEKLINKYPDIYFILCGTGVEVGLKAKVKNLNLDKNVKLFDNRRDIPMFLNTMDVYFFPSITEGQPNSLIEAMIMGLPFVASNISSIQETVGESENLYDPNDINGFFLAIEEFYMKKVSRDLMLRERTIAKFDYIKLFNQFYRSLE